MRLNKKILQNLTDPKLTCVHVICILSLCKYTYSNWLLKVQMDCCVLKLLLVNLSEKNAVVSPLGVQQPGSILQTLTLVLLQKKQFTTVFVVKLQ